MILRWDSAGGPSLSFPGGDLSIVGPASTASFRLWVIYSAAWRLALSELPGPDLLTKGLGATGKFGNGHENRSFPAHREKGLGRWLASRRAWGSAFCP